MNENEKKLLRRIVLGSALHSVQESGNGILNSNLKDELPYGIAEVMSEINGIESYIANYEKYKPYIPIIEESLQKREAMHNEKNKKER